MRTHCSSQLTDSRHYAASNIFIFNRFDLFTNCMVFSYWFFYFCHGYISEKACRPPHFSICILHSFILHFHCQCGGEFAFKSKCFTSYTSIHAWKWESCIKKRKDSILWKSPNVYKHWFNRVIQQHCFQITVSDDKTNFQICMSTSWAITY